MNIPYVIGFSLEKALQLLGNENNIVVEATLTIYDDKRIERQGNTPIVVRQALKDNIVTLTTSLFK